MNKKSIIYLCVIAMLLGSCVSTPVAAPEWTVTTPQADSTYTYFVGSSSDSTGDEALATEDAANSLVSQITRYMGVTVTVETTGEAKGTLDSYSADVTSVVKQSGESRVSGFSIKDKYIVKNGSLVTVYVLAQYITKDLEAEKQRIAALFQEREDAVAKPEAAGDSALSNGRAFDAVRYYVEAALAASDNNIDNAEIKMDRNANKARSVLSKIGFSKIDAPKTVNLGQEYPASFQAKLYYGDTAATGKGIAGAELNVSYQRMQSSGRITNKTVRVKTDSSGVVSFTPDNLPDFVGKATISFVLNLDSTKELLGAMPSKYSSYADAILEDMTKRSISFDYTIISLARTTNTGLQVLDVDENGNIASSNLAHNGLMGALTKEKFRISNTNLSTATILGMNDSTISSAAKSAFGNVIKRMIYGVARLESCEKDGAMYKSVVRMSVQCIDLENGMILYSGEKTATAVGSSEYASKNAAYTKAGKEVMAKDIMSKLP